MPFIDEQELSSLQQEIHDANVKKDELETELSNKEQEFTKIKNTSRGINVFFAVLAGVGIALATFLFMNKTSSGSNMSSADLSTFKKQETARLLDSISNAQEQDEDLDENNDSTASLDDDMSAISSATNNETIYSVQIGMFSKRKYPLVSKTIAGTTSQEELFKYSVGLFKTLKEAQSFRRQIVKIGFNDAFVASYINGKRQAIHKPN